MLKCNILKAYISKMVLIVAFLLAGCRSEVNNVLDSVRESKAPGELVKKYVEDNAYIDLDVDALVKNVESQDTGSSVNEEDMAKMKVAVYRFYKHVSVKDGYYVCGIKEGAEINISQLVFKTLLENLNEMNRIIKGAKDRGEVIDVKAPSHKKWGPPGRLWASDFRKPKRELSELSDR